MNPLVVFSMACLALVSAQSTTNTGSTGTSSSTGSAVGDPVNNPISGPLGVGGLGAGPLGTAGGTPTLPSNPNSGRGQGVNPLLLGAATGMDNLARFALLPTLSRFGPSNQMFFLSGGFDTFTKALMSDMTNRMLMRSMPGMHPMMSPLLTSQMIDSPDNWAMTNMLFNMRNNGQQQQGGASTFPSPNPTPMGGFGNLFGGLFGGSQQPQQMTGQGMALPQGAASPMSNQNNPFGSLGSVAPLMFLL